MTHTMQLMLRYSSQVVTLTNCISLRFEKERYTPYTELSGQWYCPSNIRIGEIITVILNIDGTVRHNGYPTGVELLKKDGRTVIRISSRGYTAMLQTNQCPDGMLTDVNLTTLSRAAGVTLPVVAYQPNTPTVSYVNYYDGTNMWDAIVCYSIRATGVYPYIRGFNTVMVDAPSPKADFSITSAQLISRGYSTDYSKLLTQISEKDIDGTTKTFVATNGIATQRSIMRVKEINFDREWIMDPADGLQFKLNCSTKAMSFDVFSYPGYSALDLLDSFEVTDLAFTGEVDRLLITASAEKGFVTTVWCYHDKFCT